MNRHIARKAFDLLVWLAYIGYGDEVRCHRRQRVRFAFTVEIDGQKIKGENLEMRKPFGATTKFKATPVGPAGSDYEHGTAKASVSATALDDGSDASADYSVAQDPNDELSLSVTHNGNTVSSVATVTLQADGDPLKGDDEVSPVVGTGTITTAPENVTSFDLQEVTEPATGAADSTLPVDDTANG
jgi:hypothetical protein